MARLLDEAWPDMSVEEIWKMVDESDCAGHKVPECITGPHAYITWNWQNLKCLPWQSRTGDGASIAGRMRALIDEWNQLNGEIAQYRRVDAEPGPTLWFDSSIYYRVRSDLLRQYTIVPGKKYGTYDLSRQGPGDGHV